MANELYFLQSRVEGYRGYAGIGAPVYSSVTATDATEDYTLGYTSISATTQNAVWGYGCMWAPFTNSDGTPSSQDTFWASAEMVLTCSTTYAEADLAQYAPWVIRSSTSGTMVFLKAVVGTTNSFRLLIGSDLTDTTKQVDTGIRYTSTGSAHNRYAIRFYGGGTTSGTIILFVDGVRVGSWSGDLTNYKGYDGMSFHQTTPADPLKLYYSVAANFSLRRSYAKLRVASAVGSLTGWAGNTTPFATYPVNYNAAGGLYATEAGNQVSVTLPTDPADKAGYSLAAVSLTGALVTDDDTTVASVAALVKNTTSGTITTLNAQSINADGQGYTWNIPVDPDSSAAWTSDALAGLEFGFDRTV